MYKTNASTPDYRNMSMDNKTAVIQQAFNDYRAGKTDTLNIPGMVATKAVVYFPNTTQRGTPPVDYMIAPMNTWGIKPMTKNPGETLMYNSGTSSTYAATYIGAGGLLSSYAASVDAVIPGGSNLQNFISGEIFVMHQWGTGTGAENDLVFASSVSSTVDITPYVGSYSFPWLNKITVPSTHTYYISIVPAITSGQITYNTINMYVIDENTWTMVLNDVIGLPSTQSVNNADMALEESYPSGYVRPGPLLNWRRAQNFEIHDQNGNIINLYSNRGNVFEYITSGVQTAYYHDYYNNNNQLNGYANFYFTRYVGTSYPSHP